MEEGYSHKTKFENSIMSERFARLYKRFVNNYEIKKFPIIIKAYSSEKFYIPWELIAPHEGQAQENHGQDLKKLAYRGGLAWDEAYAVLTNIKYPSREEYISMEYYKEKVEKMCWKWLESEESVKFELLGGTDSGNRYLYKAKRIDNGEWVQGYYVRGLDMYEKEMHVIFKPDTIFYAHGETDGFAEIDPSTICQCTGLIDKNRKLLWENDIVLYEGQYAPVKFGLYQASCNQMLATHQGFYLPFPEETCYRSDLGYWKNKVEVIGTLFDNPELLNGEKQ